MEEAYAYKPGEMVDHANATGSTISAGAVVQVADGRMGYAVIDIENGRTGQVQVFGIAKMTKAASDGGVSAGQVAYWNDTTNKITSVPTAMPVGTFVADAATALVVAYVALNFFGYMVPAAPELDCETGEDTADHVLVPACMNTRGVVMLLAYGVVTEAMVGSSEDQGIITVSDEDDNALCTLTPLDAAADAIGDVIVGTNPLLISSATGDAIKTVAAGKYIDCKVTQTTSGGSPAGKVRVHIMVAPLV